MIENTIFKLKIVRYQREYLEKRKIQMPDTKTILKMRRAVAARLKNEMINLNQMHIEITNLLH